MSTFHKFTSPMLRIASYAAIPIAISTTSPYKHTLLLPSTNKQITKKFIGHNRLKRPITVRLYKGIKGKIVLMLELAFVVYAWVFNSFGALLSVFGLGVFFPTIFNASFLRNVFVQRKSALCREASQRLGENERNYKIIFESNDEIVVQWPDTNDVAYLKRRMGIWRIQSVLANAQEVDRREWSDEDFLLKERVIHGKVTAEEMYEATKEEFEASEMI